MASDRKIDMVILGLLSHENLTGYDIKKRIDNGIKFFWKGSFGNIYPSLSDMEKDGRVKRFPLLEQSGGREKIQYSITDKGREALREWLTVNKSTNDLKYETLLKLFFGANVKPQITYDTILSFEEDIKIELAILKSFKTNLEKVIDNSDHLYYYLTVSFGVKSYEAYLRWCDEAKKILSRLM